MKCTESKRASNRVPDSYKTSIQVPFEYHHKNKNKTHFLIILLAFSRGIACRWTSPAISALFFKELGTTASAVSIPGISPQLAGCEESPMTVLLKSLIPPFLLDHNLFRIKTVATYLLSAIWHGVSVGYYLTFLSAALFTPAASTFRRCMRWRFVDDPSKKFFYDLFSNVVSKASLTYLTYPFVMMNLHPSIDVYM